MEPGPLKTNFAMYLIENGNSVLSRNHFRWMLLLFWQAMIWRVRIGSGRSGVCVACASVLESLREHWGHAGACQWRLCRGVSVYCIDVHQRFLYKKDSWVPFLTDSYPMDSPTIPAVELIRGAGF